MLRSLSAFGALLILSSLSVAQAQPYVPSVGDSIQIWRHQFGASGLSKGREAFIRHYLPWLSKDKVVRMTILAENRTTGELVSVHISDPFHVARQDNTPWQEIWDGMKPIHALGKAPVKMVEYRLYAIEDEGLVPKPGQNLHLWWRSVRPDSHSAVTEHLLKTLMPAFARDAARTNSYFAEADRGQLLNMAITDGDNPATRHSRVQNRLDQFAREPMRRETFRIFSVTFENKR